MSFEVGKLYLKTKGGVIRSSRYPNLGDVILILRIQDTPPQWITYLLKDRIEVSYETSDKWMKL